jgi:hypothetical protein
MATVKLSVSDAAQHLGIKDESVRKRLLRNTLTWDKDESGHVWVYLDTPDEYQDKHRDKSIDTYQDAYIALLLEQLASEREANRENRRIIMSLSQRMLELPESTPAPRESPENAAGDGPKGAAFEPESGRTQSRWQRLRRVWRGE